MRRLERGPQRFRLSDFNQGKGQGMFQHSIQFAARRLQQRWHNRFVAQTSQRFSRHSFLGCRAVLEQLQQSILCLRVAPNRNSVRRRNANRNIRIRQRRTHGCARIFGILPHICPNRFDLIAISWRHFLHPGLAHAINRAQHIRLGQLRSRATKLVPTARIHD